MPRVTGEDHNGIEGGEEEDSSTAKMAEVALRLWEGQSTAASVPNWAAANSVGSPCQGRLNSKLGKQGETTQLILPLEIHTANSVLLCQEKMEKWPSVPGRC